MEPEDRIKLRKVAGAPKILKLVEPGKITVIDFYAEWCPPCKMLSEVLDRVKDADVVMKRVDVDKEAELAAEIGIDAVPFVAMFDKRGRSFLAFTGFRDENELKALIQRARKA